MFLEVGTIGEWLRMLLSFVLPYCCWMLVCLGHKVTEKLPVFAYVMKGKLWNLAKNLCFCNMTGKYNVLVLFVIASVLYSCLRFVLFL